MDVSLYVTHRILQGVIKMFTLIEKQTNLSTEDVPGVTSVQCS